MSAKKIAFVKFGTFSHINERVRLELVHQFPEHPIEVIDVADLLGAKTTKLMARWSALRDYGLRSFWDRDWYYFDKTLYLFKQVKQALTERLRKQDYLFTFQTQSLFDASLEGLPHFVYTDFTLLANLHDPSFDRKRINPEWVSLEKQLYRNATAVFTFSRYVARSLVEQYDCNSNQVTAVYTGCSFDIADLPLKNSNYTNKQILFAGIEWERKGGPELIEAFKQVLKAHPDAQLTILGCKPQVDVPNIRIVGRVPLQDLHGYYQRSSIFCLPSRRDPFPIVLIAAALYKLPIITTRSEALCEYLSDGENSYLTESGQVNSLANALINLLDQPERCRQFGERIQAIAQQKLTWERVGEAIKQRIDATLTLPVLSC
jgi:glycosyltransferase involved in cell wall biosynthesis